jgi:hypothetical protein
MTNELLLPYFVKKNVTKGQRKRLKLKKDTKVSTFPVVYPRSDRLSSGAVGNRLQLPMVWWQFSG